MARRQWLRESTIAHIRRHGGTILPPDPGMITENGVLSRYFQRFLDGEGLVGRTRFMTLEVSDGYNRILERIPFVVIMEKEVKPNAET